jgi:hypothetical protein
VALNVQVRTLDVELLSARVGTHSLAVLDVGMVSGTHILPLPVLGSTGDAVCQEFPTHLPSPTPSGCQ